MLGRQHFLRLPQFQRLCILELINIVSRHAGELDIFINTHFPPRLSNWASRSRFSKRSRLRLSD